MIRSPWGRGPNSWLVLELMLLCSKLFLLSPAPQSSSNPMCWENLTWGLLISTFWSKWVGLNPLLSVNLIFGYFQFKVLVLQHSSTSIDSIKGSNAGYRAGIVWLMDVYWYDLFSWADIGQQNWEQHTHSVYASSVRCHKRLMMPG